jgi:hypothetical protein
LSRGVAPDSRERVARGISNREALAPTGQGEDLRHTARAAHPVAVHRARSTTAVRSGPGLSATTENGWQRADRCAPDRS